MGQESERDIGHVVESGLREFRSHHRADSAIGIELERSRLPLLTVGESGHGQVASSGFRKKFRGGHDDASEVEFFNGQTGGFGAVKLGAEANILKGGRCAGEGRGNEVLGDGGLGWRLEGQSETFLAVVSNEIEIPPVDALIFVD